ncbi:MAG: rhamnogalacturonan lyase [Prevotella sp.]|nr:rhamnogalacturonan lyase [Prevotella sp.]
MNRLRLYAMTLLASAAVATNAQTTPVSQMERLDRGVVALTAAGGKGNFVSWRFLGTDDESTTTFDLLRDGNKIASDLYTTNYVDAGGTATSSYQVVTKVNGEIVSTGEAATAWGNTYKILNLDRPATGANGGNYSPNDCSVGDVDGDGQYEIFVKWDPDNSKDNSQNGITDNVFIDCYKLDGTKLWRIDLGRNIRAGAHYTQFMVYDFDGDGKAEMMLKTAPGSKDGKGQYVNQATTDETIKSADNTKDYAAAGGGRINGGHEYLTVFSGLTGEAIHTIAYNPNRNAKSALSAAAGTFNWDTRSGKSDTGSYGNRGERYLAGVAYIDGADQNASGIFCRGYYTYAFVWAVSFDGKQLHPRWLSEHRDGSSYKVTTYDAEGQETTKTYTGCKPTSGSGSGTMFQNGNHNMSIGDVDGDGCDEVIWGSAALNNDGTLLYGTGFGHGDAIHLSDLNPDRPGLELFQVHEEKGTYAWDLHDAATGEILAKGGPAGVDNGRGMAAQLDANFHGFYFSSAAAREQRSALTGEQVSSGQTSLNFRVYWDGNLQDELLDGNKIDGWNGNGTSRIYINGKDLYNQGGPASSCNGSKSTPNLQADILGDWREEIILHNGADQIAIYSTNTPTAYRLPTLMHDHTYRMGICWQNTAYNQPPHLGYYLPDAMKPQLTKKEYTVNMGEDFEIVVPVHYASSITIKASFTPDGTRKPLAVPADMSRISDATYKTFGLKGTAQQEGDYVIALSMKNLEKSSTSIPDTLIIHSVNMTGIEQVEKDSDRPTQIYDMQGRQRSDMQRGLYIIRRGGKTYKVFK